MKWCTLLAFFWNVAMFAGPIFGQATLTDVVNELSSIDYDLQELYYIRNDTGGIDNDVTYYLNSINSTVSTADSDICAAISALSFSGGGSGGLTNLSPWTYSEGSKEFNVRDSHLDSLLNAINTSIINLSFPVPPTAAAIGAAVAGDIGAMPISSSSSFTVLDPFMPASAEAANASSMLTMQGDANGLLNNVNSALTYLPSNLSFSWLGHYWDNVRNVLSSTVFGSSISGTHFSFDFYFPTSNTIKAASSTITQFGHQTCVNQPLTFDVPVDVADVLRAIFTAGWALVMSGWVWSQITLTVQA